MAGAHTRARPTLLHSSASGDSGGGASAQTDPFFRRRDIQALFGLQKRQAVNLMHRIGAVRVSRELALPQRDLVRWLERRISEPSAAIEQHRGGAALNELSAWICGTLR